MSITGVGSERDAAGVDGLGSPVTPLALSAAQRRELAAICRLHEQGLGPWRFSRRSLLLTLYVAFTLGFSVLLLNMTAFAPPAYLFLGFVLSNLLMKLRLHMLFRVVWPVCEAVIDWPRAFHLLKGAGGPQGGNAADPDA